MIIALASYYIKAPPPLSNPLLYGSERGIFPLLMSRCPVVCFVNVYMQEILGMCIVLWCLDVLLFILWMYIWRDTRYVHRTLMSRCPVVYFVNVYMQGILGMCIVLWFNFTLSRLWRDGRLDFKVPSILSDSQR